MEVRTLTDEERIQQLENELEMTILFGEEADRKYEEVCSLLQNYSTNYRLLNYFYMCLSVHLLTLFNHCVCVIFSILLRSWVGPIFVKRVC